VLQNTETSLEHHHRFIRRVALAKSVWGLRNADGWAVADSTEFENVDVMPFWSDEAYARRAARDGWSSYVPTRIPVAEFIDNWLQGMHAEHVLVGTNWDANNCGLEVEPAKLASELLNALDALAANP
jgi:hypothetical protein